MGKSQTVEHTWDEGTLTLGLFQVNSKYLIWVGPSSASVENCCGEAAAKSVGRACKAARRRCPV
ncbi:MAG: hypothetical protein AMS21_08420 [Gemmatimonas sp. SG8_38_2]|nr:MAG: hypothetical protein AMS21_08420 [Gemmatimonas sp. SG8_38_2]